MKKCAKKSANLLIIKVKKVLHNSSDFSKLEANYPSNYG